MIPDNITKEHIEQAIAYIDENVVPQYRSSSRYLLKHNGKNYPPKYVISIANKFVNGEELDPDEFKGGKETNNFLRSKGFIIIPIDKEEINAKQNTEDFIKQPITQNDMTLTADDLLRMRSRIINLLNQIDPVTHRREGLAGRVNRLTRAGNIPREVAPWFRTITEMRNVVEYEGRELTEDDSKIVLAVWNAIKTWASENGYTIEDIN